MAASSRRLQAADNSATTVLVQCRRLPVIRGGAPDGTDCFCSGCGTQLLLESVPAYRLWDLGFKCSACEAVSAVPRLLVNDPLPEEISVIPAGWYAVEDSIDLAGETLVGAAGLERVNVVRRPGFLSFKEADQVATIVPDIHFVVDLLEQVRALMGEAFEVMAQKDRRRVDGGSTIGKRHGLMVACDALRRSVESHRTSTPDIDGVALCEVHTLLRLVDRWRHHPQSEQIVSALARRDEYSHTMLLLELASFYQDARNALEILPTSTSRTPDLRLRRRYWDWLGMEVKAPFALFRPETNTLTGRAAYDLIVKAMKKARAGGGQLSGVAAGVLVVGGHFFSLSTAQVLHSAAAAYLAHAASLGRHPYLEGISIAAATVVVDPDHPDGVEARPLLTHRLVRHPGFAGESTIVTEGPNDLSPAPRQLWDVGPVVIDTETRRMSPG